MKKLLTFLLMLFFLQVSVQAKPVKNGFGNIIKDSGVNQSDIAIEIKELDTGKSFYSKNTYKLMPAAPVQNLLVLVPIVEILGDSYEFTTELYSRDQNSFIIKLGADPYLSSSNLKDLVNKIDADAQKVYIDDSVLKTDIISGADNPNSNELRTSAYNLNNNTMKITIMPAPKPGENAVILNAVKYPVLILNNVITSDITKIETVQRKSGVVDILEISGTISRKPVKEHFPIPNIKRYFKIELRKALENHKIYLKESFAQTQIKASDAFVYKITHDLNRALDDILKSSNNLVYETLSVLAVNKYRATQSETTLAEIELFNKYCTKNKLDTSGIKIPDNNFSGANLVSTNFIVDFLILNKDNKIMEHLPSPGEGSLTDRLLPMKNSLKAKTGAIGNSSVLAGYLVSKSCKKYGFCIINNDSKQTIADKKALEDYIVREAYLRL